MYMIQPQSKNIKSSKGFTIAEVIFSIFITILVIWILQNLLVNLKTANKSNHHTNDVAFAYVQFTRFLKDDNTETAYALPNSSNSYRAVVAKIKRKGKKKVEQHYILEKYKNMIRATTSDGGHMPLLLNIENASFVTIDKQVKINITEKDGRKSELYFKLDPKPVESDKTSGKNDKKDAKKTESKRASK